MKFGSVENPSKIDFKLPKDDAANAKIIAKGGKKKLAVYVGCAKWNKTDLKNFYPKGVKDELEYYAGQFNSIELNATFYRMFPPEQFTKWKEKTPADFRFFPKVTQDISHLKRLKDTEKLVDTYVHAVGKLEKKLGMAFLQMHENFKPKDFDRVVNFVEYWPKEFPLAMEFRDTAWYNDKKVAADLYKLLEKYKIANVIVDTAGRRDLLHMRLTSPHAFVRFVGANHSSDYKRLDDWVKKIEGWVKDGLKEVYFFIHQNVEKESPLLSAYFIEKLNKKLKTDLKIPQTLINVKNNSLF